VHRPGAYVDPDVALTESVRRALRQLEPELRATVVLRYYADLGVAEIARLLDVAEGTVKSRLHRAAAVLRDALKEDA
jgi:RNA polymerase sigma-70 factor (ECF subfamily)